MKRRGEVYLALLRAYAKHGGCVSMQHLVGCKQDAVALHAYQTTRPFLEGENAKPMVRYQRDRLIAI